MPMQQEWVEHITCMIPENLRKKPDLKNLMEELFKEVRDDFKNSMKKSMGRNIFISLDH